MLSLAHPLSSPSSHFIFKQREVHDWSTWLVVILCGDRSRIHSRSCLDSQSTPTRPGEDETPGYDSLILTSNSREHGLTPVSLVDRTSSSRLGSSLRIIRGILHGEGGLAAFYRGLAPNLLGNSTSWALYFLFYSKLKDTICMYRAQEGWILTSSDYFVASGTAGMHSHNEARILP